MENRSFTQQNFNLNTPNDENRPPKPDNSQVLAIIGTVVGAITCGFCCIGSVIGIIAIVFSTQVNKKYNYGDYLGAESAAKTAKILSFISLGIAGLTLIWIIIQIASGGTAEYMQKYQDILNELSNK